MERTLLPLPPGAAMLRARTGQAQCAKVSAWPSRDDRRGSACTAFTRPAHYPGGHAAGDTFCANPLPAAAGARAIAATTSCAAPSAVAAQTASGTQAHAGKASLGPAPS